MKEQKQQIEPGYLAAREAARYVGVSQGYFYVLLARGDLAPIRIGRKCVRFAREDLDRYMSSRKVVL